MFTLLHFLEFIGIGLGGTVVVLAIPAAIVWLDRRHEKSVDDLLANRRREFRHMLTDHLLDAALDRFHKS